ncbi:MULTISPECIES: hypothetical protein [unclassified Pseudomonas]|uniref:hypothetical protein n=1 Tax=unclassified Pseudomonas TaxID=196821 RepID=UPI0011AA93C4|nr:MULTISPECIES: hypothetical protein [unclassified Pseudomonas]TWC10865.1 hypothetical protein FBY00_13833 [Pseudomonas sp. SJZ075]TWC28362.1 hypothetical protein FBY02_13157 [Pseudomonas sp. SJZ078]TWC46795.1 hypothetical protein FBY11_13833 [Pseudomonas sp. SJZ124]TWC82111.1 hypothetical protein FBY09_1376 [Pseudomonas sp. SJZ101]
MKKTAQVIMNAQIPFSIGNLDRQQLRGTPTLFRREGLDEPFEYPKIEEFPDHYAIRCSTDIRPNRHGQIYNYTPATQQLNFTSPDTTYTFNLNKFGNQVIYSTNSPGASVRAPSIVFEDFPGLIQLEMRIPGKEIDQKPDEDGWLEVQINDQVVKHPSTSPVLPAPKKTALPVVINPTDKFSFLGNVTLYLSGCDVYQEYPPGEMGKIDKFVGTMSTDLYLTPDKSYPPGVTTLTIEDGFSDATAVIEFNHDTSKKQVTMTIKSFRGTGKLCDIRDFPYLDKYYPNAICIAL